MFIELIDSLRCVRQHDFTWLVAAVTEIEARHILSGSLGCPACHAEYPIVDGVTDFTAGAATGDEARGAPATPAAADAPDDPDLALRAAALLDLASPGGFVVLAGEWGAAAPELRVLAEGVHVLALDPPATVAGGGTVSVARVGDDVPVRSGAARGIALDRAHASPRGVAAAVAALRPLGRLIAPASLGVPGGVTLLARDERHWVASKDAAPGAVVQLTLGRAEGGSSGRADR